MIYPKSKVKIEAISDGTSNTLMLGETSSAIGRPLLVPRLGRHPAVDWGYYNYENVTQPAEHRDTAG